MKNQIEQPLCVIHTRVSSPKQAQEGESHDAQEVSCRKVADVHDAYVDGVWHETYSGRKDDREIFDEVLKHVEKRKGAVKYYICYAIHRFTRGGSYSYEQMKRELAKRGVEMLDAQGIIQPAKNSMEELGESYDWSKYYPSETTELLEATRAKHEVRDILTRLISQEIRNTRAGYKVRAPHDGYVNKQVFVHNEGKRRKRTVCDFDTERAKFYIAMVELRAGGQLSDKEIVERVNAMGFLTKIKNKWNKDKTKITGHSGGVPLTVKHLQAIMQRPALCGVICEKWTKWKPVKAQWVGLVDINAFNRANRGKVFITTDVFGTPLEVIENYKPEVHTQENPLFPYKNVIRCTICGKPFMGSASRSRNGKYHPAYHCARKHERIGVNKVKFDDNVEDFIHNLNFKPEALPSLYCVLVERFRRRQAEVLLVAADVGKTVIDLEDEKRQVALAFAATNSSSIRQELEQQMEKLDQRLRSAQTERNKLELTEKDLEDFITRVRRVMEHPARFLLYPGSTTQQQAYFSLMFEELPNYDEVVAGTPKLTWVFKLNPEDTEPESDSVRPLGFEPRTFSLKGSRSTD